MLLDIDKTAIYLKKYQKFFSLITFTFIFMILIAVLTKFLMYMYIDPRKQYMSTEEIRLRGFKGSI